MELLLIVSLFPTLDMELDLILVLFYLLSLLFIPLLLQNLFQLLSFFLFFLFRSEISSRNELSIFLFKLFCPILVKFRFLSYRNSSISWSSTHISTSTFLSFLFLLEPLFTFSFLNELFPFHLSKSCEENFNSIEVNFTFFC